MPEDNKHPKNQPIPNNVPKQINESRNFNEKIGDLINKSEKTSEGHYAKPFINQIIQTSPEPGITDSSNTNNTSSDE